VQTAVQFPLLPLPSTQTLMDTASPLWVGGNYGSFPAVWQGESGSLPSGAWQGQKSSVNCTLI
jgi:hypothetical protein